MTGDKALTAQEPADRFLTADNGNSPLPAPSYVPSEGEALALDRQRRRQADQTPTPKMELGEQEGKALALQMHHDDKATAEALLMESLGTARPDFLNGINLDLVNLAHQSKATDAKMAFGYALSIVQGVKPQDELEALLGVQMAAIHFATVEASRALARSETIKQIDCNERVLNKLARTFAAQMDTLKRYRSRGESKVTVEHVTVNEGGQAIVGANIAPGRGRG